MLGCCREARADGKWGNKVRENGGMWVGGLC